MALYYSHPSSQRHDTGPHPENAGRLVAIEKALDREGWPGLDRVEAPAATREQIVRAHAEDHYDAIESFCAAGGGMIDMDTAAGPDSFEAARRAAGAAANAAERMLAGDQCAAFCAMRPPGHHAERDRAMGFCLFNNVAVAATHALAACGAERVLILDWDVHHGNGTEQIFASSPDVLYASIHEWPLYPGTGAAEFTGTGEGVGYTVNLPVGPGADSEQFIALVSHVVAPIARAYRPDLIAISAGYDAHRDDPLASCLVETDAYGEMTAVIRDVAAQLEVPVLVCLEGGYAPGALAESVVATVAALNDDRPPTEVSPKTAESHLARLRDHWEI